MLSGCASGTASNNGTKSLPRIDSQAYNDDMLMFAFSILRPDWRLSQLVSMTALHSPNSYFNSRLATAFLSYVP